MSIVGLFRDSRRDDKLIDARNDQEIAQLTHQAAVIGEKTGKQPDSWETFKEENQEKPGRPLRSALIAALGGIIAGAALVGAVALTFGLGGMGNGVLLAARVGALAGAAAGLIGWDREITRENNNNTRLVNNYKAYIEGYKESQAHQRDNGAPAAGQYRNDHAQKLKERDEQSVEATRGV